MTEKVGRHEVFADAAPVLRRPFTPEAVKWKIQNLLGGKDPKTAKGGLIVAYIDARLVIERLNLVAPGWRDDYTPMDGGAMRCDLTVCGLTRKGFGKHADIKAAESDSLKRAGVKFGIGVSLYALAQVTLWRVEGKEPVGNKLRPDYAGRLALDDHNRKWLADTYARWLETDRGKHFGEPLDHGDEFGAADPLDPDATAPEAPADPVNDEMERLRQDVEVAYLSIDKKLMPQGKYRALYASATTEDELRGLLAQIEALKEEAA